jgi:hypothetical protein
MDPLNWVHFCFPYDLLLLAIRLYGSHQVIHYPPENPWENGLAGQDVFFTQIIRKMNGSSIIFTGGYTIISFKVP